MAFNRLLNNFKPNFDLFPCYITSVDYDLTIENQIVANNLANSYCITSDTFSYLDSGQQEESGQSELHIYLLGNNSRLQYPDFVKKLKGQGLRPATLKEILSLSASDFKSSKRVLALGSIYCDFGGYVFFPFIQDTDSGRILKMGYENIFYKEDDCIYAAVPIIK